LFNHDASNLVCSILVRPESTACAREKLLSVYRYSSNRIHFFLLLCYSILLLCLVSNALCRLMITCSMY
jgi:hypothetical protein